MIYAQLRNTCSIYLGQDQCHFGDRSFKIAGPTEWNALSLDIKQANSVETFKSRLKAHLFRQHFGKNAGINMMNERDSVG